LLLGRYGVSTVAGEAFCKPHTSGYLNPNASEQPECGRADCGQVQVGDHGRAHCALDVGTCLMCMFGLLLGSAVLSALQWKQVGGIVLECTAKRLPVHTAHIPGYDRNGGNLDGDIIPSGENRSNPRIGESRLA
jgi:hypothetical protein